MSGSGKSSLAFDTLYAEGQRRYVESLSAYARQFLQLMEKPDVDLIEGLSPAISIEQKATSHNPRSTVGTVTEIHDYLRLLYARVGDPYCPDHPEQKLAAMTISQMVDATLAFPEDTKLMILAPVVVNRKGEQLELMVELRAKGFVRVRVDGKVYEIDAVPKLAKNTKHTVEVVVDRLRVRQDLKQRLAESAAWCADRDALEVQGMMFGLDSLEDGEALDRGLFAVHDEVLVVRAGHCAKMLLRRPRSYVLAVLGYLLDGYDLAHVIGERRADPHGGRIPQRADMERRFAPKLKRDITDPSLHLRFCSG